MSKTKEELNALKTEVESLKLKLNELTDDELNLVAGGSLELKPPAPDASEMEIPGPGETRYSMVCVGP